MKDLFSFIFLVFLTVNLFAQNEGKLYLDNAVEIDTNRYDEHQGTPYFFEDYTRVNVTSVGGVLIEDIQANYYGLEGEWEILHNGKHTKLASKLYTDIWIKLNESSILKGTYPNEFRFSSKTDFGIPNNYVIVLHEDEKVKLYEHFYIYENEIKKEAPVKTEVTKKLHKKHVYQLVIGSKKHDIKMNKRSLLKALGSKKEMEKILEETDNRLKNRMDLIRLINHLNEIGFF